MCDWWAIHFNHIYYLAADFHFWAIPTDGQILSSVGKFWDTEVDMDLKHPMMYANKP